MYINFVVLNGANTCILVNYSLLRNTILSEQLQNSIVKSYKNSQNLYPLTQTYYMTTHFPGFVQALQ